MEYMEKTREMKARRLRELDVLSGENKQTSSLKLIKRPSLCKTHYRDFIAGYGGCSRCSCRGFEKEVGSEVCRNCGHNYHDHW